MSIIHLFHGTSYNRYLSIKENGFSSCKSTIWNCADEEMTYFYEMEKLCESECMEDEEEATKIQFCSERANESAQITSAIEKVPGNFTVVFELMVEDSVIEEYMEPDDSCENMSDVGAVTVPSNVLNELIDMGVIKVKVHFFPFNSKFSLFYLVGLIENEYFQDTLLECLSYAERSVLKQLNKDGIFIDEIFGPQDECLATEEWN